MKVSIELVHEQLEASQLGRDVIQKIMKDIESQGELEAQAAAIERGPRIKKQLVMIISDPRGTLPDGDYVGWVVQVPEDERPEVALERIIRASYEYNVSKKGRKYPVNTIGEACEAFGARFLKDNGVAVKTKTPVTILRTDNKIPHLASDF